MLLGCCAPAPQPQVEVSRAAVTMNMSSPIDLRTGSAIGVYRPAAAFSGSEYLVVWTDGRNGNDDIYAGRVSTSGAGLDPNGFAVAAGSTHIEAQPSVAWGQGSWLVAWNDDRAGASNFDIWGTIISPQGVVQAEFPISLASSQQLRPLIASNDSEWLVVWDDQRSGRRAVWGARVSYSGVVLDPSGIQIAADVNWDKQLPAVAASSGKFFVAWTDIHDVSGTTSIVGRYVFPDGGSAPTSVSLSGTSTTASNPTIATTGTAVIADWDEVANDGTFDLMRGGIVSTTATLIASPIFAAPGDQRLSALTFDGTDYVTAWLDTRAGVSLFAGRSSSNRAIDDGGFPVASVVASLGPAIASNGAGQSLVAFIVPDLPNFDARAVLIDFPSDGGGGADGGFTLDGGFPVDAGTELTDAGSTSDAGITNDAGSASDAGNTSDAGNASDAGNSSDAGSPSDGGVPREVIAELGCRSTPGELMLPLALLLILQRRRAAIEH
jgi:hypothetical protein